MVSVIIPTYNRSDLLCQAIESVLAQTYTDYEIIVVDDGSTEDIKNAISVYGRKVKYLFQRNAGVYSARNNGIRESQGEYIAFLDSDDIWEPEKLDIQILFLEQNPDFGAVHSDSSTIDKNGKLIETSVNAERQSHNGMVFDEFFEHNMAVILLSTVVIRRECFEKVGLFDEQSPVATDHFFFLRLAYYYPIAFINEPLVRYRLTEGSLSRRDMVENVTWREKLLEEFIEEFSEYFSTRPDLVNKKWLSFYMDAGMKLFYAKEYPVACKYFRNIIVGADLCVRPGQARGGQARGPARTRMKAILYYLRAWMKNNF